MDLTAIISSIDIAVIAGIVPIAVSLCALAVSWANRRSQRSARLVAEVLPEERGVFLYVSNAGERIAYDVAISVEPTGLSDLAKVVTTIAPQASFRTLLCAYRDLPPQAVRVTMRYHDPQHKRKLAKRVGTFNVLSMESHRVIRPESSSCSTIIE